MRGWIALVLAVSRVAAADDDERTLSIDRAPGFANDRLGEFLGELLAVQTRDGFSLEGGVPADAVVWLDEFAVPGFHRDGRSAFAIEGVGSIEISGKPDATRGPDGRALASLTDDDWHYDRWIGSASTREAIAAYRSPYETAVVRTSLLPFAASPGGDRVFVDAPNSQDAMFRWVLGETDERKLTLNGFASRDQVQLFDDRSQHLDQRFSDLRDSGRVTLTARHKGEAWEASAAQSVSYARSDLERGLEQHEKSTAVSFDTRELLRHAIADVAGLEQIEWTLAAEAHITHYDLDLAGPADDRENVARAGIAPSDDISHVFHGTLTTPDVAGSAGVLAWLSPSIGAYAALRVDAFGSDVALEPRGLLQADLGGKQFLVLTAGAYRRAAEQGEELEHAELHPERTSRVQLELEHYPEHGTYYDARAFYVDRTHLIVRDQLGNLVNTGNGTTYGVYGLVGHQQGHWRGQLALRLEHDDRQDAPRMPVRTFEYSQPFRLEARLVRFVGAWSFGARFELRQGLPYTAVVGNDYNSDRDVYTPQFADLYAERLPWQHQLDLRIDHAWRHVAVFLDVANVYDHRQAIGYAYNFDFTERRAIQAPAICPTLGVRGDL